MNHQLFLNCPRSNYVRTNYVLLNGRWDFIFDKENKGEELSYSRGFEKEWNIIVPFPYETKLSGINIPELVENVWYQRHLDIKKEKNRRYILHLEGVDHLSKVFVNGNYVGQDFGAYHRHSFDVTDNVLDGDNLLVIKCEDSFSKEQLRGKQRNKGENYECWYLDFVGIYKSVWLEVVNEKHIQKIKITPDLDAKSISFDILLSSYEKLALDISIFEKDVLIGHTSVVPSSSQEEIVVKSDKDVIPWSVENPYLYDLVFLLKDDKGNILDEVFSYAGFRKLEVKDGLIYMNHQKLFQKLVLDQGYWKDSLATPPCVDALKDDIVKMKAFGFNGCRKHEKVEDERFLYLCDILGYLLWEEIPSFYEYSEKSKELYLHELKHILEDNYNHPSIITWTLFNESWGIYGIRDSQEQQAFVDDMYHFTKRFDPYRFVITNDGWDHTLSDILTIHHYHQNGEELYSFYDSRDHALQDDYKGHYMHVIANGYKDQGQPIIFSEFGGTAFIKNTHDGNWGYGIGVKDDEEYLERLNGLFSALQRMEYSSGYCYTQVSDVEQEVNGLLNHEHKPKIAPKLLKEIQDKR